MKVLIACEESQTECIAFRKKGHEAFSCDIQECSGGHPEWHIHGDVLKILRGGCSFETQNGDQYNIDGHWDLIIAHPPCTYLSNVATRSFSTRCTPAEKVIERWKERAKAAVFFMQFMCAPCDRIAVENPVGFMSTAYRKADQIVQPFEYADTDDEKVTKATCLWLKGLPPLVPSTRNKRPNNAELYGRFPSGKAKTWEDQIHGSKARSKSFAGIANAMADQWG